LTSRLNLIAGLAVGFVALTAAVAAGATRGLDRSVASLLGGLWLESLHPLFQGIALLGGLELTALVTAGLGVYLWRGGFRREVWALAAYPASGALEYVYKRQIPQAGPPLHHADGPSLSLLFFDSSAHYTFPSGHMLRTVLVYGLLAFVLYRLVPAGRLRGLVVPAVVAICAAMAFDRVYLEVHWESDVVGGLLLGGVALAAATLWLDRPQEAGE